ncbi:hypothetical protein BVC80_8983g15 [Macleaya cordata]|uniref:Uncharacterized protein n=1 Tax=Macleaya cordata TaxID=56857 RepID=A0A200QIY8_MACCD|nr:hypothetical protein BVC80_8983g15 [Macleaya cordata]
MADIAMLVAEEYERRIKMSSSTSTKGIIQEEKKIDLVTCVSVLAAQIRLDEFSWVKKVEDNKEKFEYAKKILDPKSPFGLAAINGFFSA